MATDKTIYDDDSIESLAPREHVRLRPGMYAGDTSNPNQLLLEIFSNALDEYNLGHGTEISVGIEADGTCWVNDNGQGFPVNVVREEDGKTILEAAFSVMNTSGKFSDDGVYGGTSLGLNGIGSKLTNFLSSWLEVYTWNAGGYEHIWFKDGIFEKRESGKEITQWQEVHNGNSGTWVKWKPDPQFFDSDRTDVNYFRNFLNDIACLCPGLYISYCPHEGYETILHHHFVDIIDRKVGNNIEIINDRFVIDYAEKDFKMDLAITFTGKAAVDILPYVNYGYTTVGPHITAIKSTITRIFNNWAKENGILKKGDKNFDGTAIQEGMLLVCNIVSQNVAYNAQVKTTITKMDTSTITSTLGKELEIWLDNNPDAAKTILEKADRARRAAEAAKKAREAVKNQNAEQKVKKVVNLPSKLSDCYSTKRSECEIYIKEGDSASGNLKKVRDNEFQAVLPVRGKILNTQKATLDKIMKNAEIVDMIKAFGLKISADGKRVEYKKENIRYGKIIIMSDADVDGAHIKSLFYTFIWNFAPGLFDDGFIYAGIPPLYRLKNNKEVLYIKDDEALEEFKQKNDITKYQVSRLKGLGEMDEDETEECLIDKNTRIIKQVTVEDLGKADILFDTLMGSRAESRKAFLEANAERAEIYV